MELTCSDIRESLSAMFADRVKISTRARYCVITLPLQSVDQRHVSLVVEKTVGDKLRVHDAGKTDSSLFAQGVNVTKARLNVMRKVADSYGVTIGEDHLIQKLCDLSAVNAAILDVAQCAILASQEIVGHKTVVEEESLSRRLRDVFSDWRPPFLEKIVSNAKVQGETAVHNFPFVAFPRNVQNRAVAVKVLYPSHAQWQAERYGFLVHDLRGMPIYGQWARITVLSRAEEWPRRAVELVRNLSDQTVSIRSGDEPEAIAALPDTVGRLMRAA